MKSHSVELPGMEFLDICLCLDKCQVNAREYLLGERDAKEGAVVMNWISGNAESIIFYAYGAYTITSRRFPLVTTRLSLNEFTGEYTRLKVQKIKACRVPAIATYTGTGPRFVISLYRPRPDFPKLTGYEAMKKDPNQRGDYWIINSREIV